MQHLRKTTFSILQVFNDTEINGDIITNFTIVPYITTSHLRVVPLAWLGSTPCMRLEVFACLTKREFILSDVQ